MPFRGIDLNVIMVDSVGRVEADNTSGFKPLILDNLLKHDLSIIEKFTSLLSHSLIVENLRVGTVRVLSSDLPALEEGIPIDEGY